MNSIDDIQKRRMELGYSQEYLAYKLGISQNSYSKIERGITTLTVARFIDICQILELEPAETFENVACRYLSKNQ